MPPAAEATTAMRPRSRLSVKLKYSSRSISEPASTYTLLTGSPCGAGLLGHQALAEHRRPRSRHRVEIAHQLDAAGLAATAGVHLRLDDPDRAAEGTRGGFGFVGIGGHQTFRNGDAVARKNFLGLVFVQVHQFANGSGRCGIVAESRDGCYRAAMSALSETVASREARATPISPGASSA